MDSEGLRVRARIFQSKFNDVPATRAHRENYLSHTTRNHVEKLLILSVIGPPMVHWLSEALKTSPLSHISFTSSSPPPISHTLRPLDTLHTTDLSPSEFWCVRFLHLCANFTQNHNTRPSAILNRQLSSFHQIYSFYRKSCIYYLIYSHSDLN